MIADPSDRRATSSEPPVGSESNELSSELVSELMVLKDTGLERGEGGSDNWAGDTTGERWGSLGRAR
jgi:hypothetical protein